MQELKTNRTEKITLSNGNTIEYKIINGTAYHKQTHQNVVDVLEMARSNRLRIKIDLGDIETGKSWNEIFDVTGYVGRSTGNIKIPLLIHNKRCYGGGAILDHCIIKIECSNKKDGGVLYQHSKYHK